VPELPINISQKRDKISRAGRKGDARAILHRMIDPKSGKQAFDIARTYLALGDLDRGFEWLRTSVDKKETGARFLKVDPNFDDVRSDPRFQALVARLNIRE